MNTKNLFLILTVLALIFGCSNQTVTRFSVIIDHDHDVSPLEARLAVLEVLKREIHYSEFRVSRVKDDWRDECLNIWHDLHKKKNHCDANIVVRWYGKHETAIFGIQQICHSEKQCNYKFIYEAFEEE